MEVEQRTKVHSTIVRSSDVSEEEPLDLGDVHRLFNGSVPTADVKQAALQRGLAGHHSEENSHLVVPEARRRQEMWGIAERDAEGKQRKPQPEAAQKLPCCQLLQ